MVMLIAVLLVIRSILFFCHHWRMICQLFLLEKTVDEPQKELKEMQKIAEVQRIPASDEPSSNSSAATPATGNSTASAASDT